MKYVGFLFLALTLSLAAAKAEDAIPGRTAGAGASAKDKADKAAGDAGTRAAGAREKGDGPVTNVVGTLDKATDAKFAAVLKAHGKTLNLIATPDVADKLAELVKKSAKVRVTGNEEGDDTIKVTKVTESGEKADGGDKPKKKKKDDK